MSDKEHQESAFPCTDARGFIGTGMTLRDWFAGQAMTGIIANQCTGPFAVIKSKVAERAYELADAMMGARKK
jgi:hypothetical protein